MYNSQKVDVLNKGGNFSYKGSSWNVPLSRNSHSIIFFPYTFFLQKYYSVIVSWFMLDVTCT